MGKSAFDGSELWGASPCSIRAEVRNPHGCSYQIGNIFRFYSSSLSPFSLLHLRTLNCFSSSIPFLNEQSGDTAVFRLLVQAAPPSATIAPPLGVAMAKPAVLLIGGLSHARKEWEECASFATLKVSALVTSWGTGVILSRHLRALREKSS